MVYAPVIIYTLNRDEHLRRCIESLKQDNMAKKTEIYISVDFPPSEKYIDGYERVKKYLKDGIDGFAAVHTFFQTSNLGPHLNRMFLIKMVMEKYDRYIESEDDSEFSPNFLQYMNEQLDRYVDDPEVYSVTAMSEPIRRENYKYAVIKSVVLPIHGMGTWSKKTEELYRIKSYEFVYGNARKFRKMRNFYHDYPYLFSLFVDEILFSRNKLYADESGEIMWCDVPVSIYLALTSKYCIKPVISKCRDWGYDGSGVNTKKVDEAFYEQASIDASATYECQDNREIPYDKDLARKEQEFYYKFSNKNRHISWMKYLLFYFLGWDWHRTEKLKELLKK